MRSCASLCSRVNRLCYHCSIAIPLGVVYSLVTWAWVVFSFTICVQEIGNASGVFFALLSTFMYGMTIWSYTSACFTAPGSPSMCSGEMTSSDYSILPQHNRESPSFASVTVKDDGTERYCQKCRCKKPDRTHHCRSCGRCILSESKKINFAKWILIAAEMDHHCPWLATCIGFHNQKQFLLFLLYVSCWCNFMCVVSTFFLWDFFTIHLPEQVEETFLPINWIVLSILSGMVGLVVGGFGMWHVSLVLRNYTTIEYMEETRFKGDQKRYLMAQSVKDKFNIFDLNYRENWRQVMGDSILTWFVPERSAVAGDGYNFPISERAKERLRIQQNLHSFEREHTFVDGRQQHYALEDFRESMDWQQ